ncbi:ABC transporter ATP-binding protein [Usitatibacter palustris]|uniref:Putative ribonucleotide transport ATP-binding protein mkl n=1 Tax=Usitatibacter palustris TaxID=2732487 RepID=A0A6M4HBJ5_9PROT|nr:ATP-binding cassette domain-containing protein [Usitatibacter palustris]QJR15337.1 putative ribonucleotide transport ATP-binding protein mkl [Usitatibacter palustris]
MNATPIATARGIVNRFGAQEVHKNLSLDIQEGEILGVAGGSGSGKSVLLRTLTGLHTPVAGEVLLEGKAVATINGAERAALLGVLFQQGALFSSLTVAQNITLPIGLHKGLPPEECERIAAEKLELVGLPVEHGKKFPSELSGGMVKRAAFARALALDPRILFLDEPTSGLDPVSASGIDDLILQLNDELGITMVLITHDLSTIFTVCDRVAMLVDGNVVVDTVDNLLESKQPWIHEFLHGPRAEAAATARKATHNDRTRKAPHGNG